METTTQVQKAKEEKKAFVPPPGKQPNVNRQQKTEDVTNTKGMSFSDFRLSEELQLVRIVDECKVTVNLLTTFLGHIRNGFRVPISNLGGSNPANPRRQKCDR